MTSKTKTAAKTAANLSANVGTAKPRKGAGPALPPAPAPDAHAVARRESLQRQETGTGSLMLDGFNTCAVHGLYTLEEVAEFYPSCGSPTQYVANFGRAHKAAAVIGSDGVLDVIREAAALDVKGRAFDKIMAALSAVMDAGAALAKNGHKVAVTGHARSVCIAGALTKAEKAMAEKKANAKKGAKPGKVTTTKTDGPAEIVADVIAIGPRVAKIEAPKGRAGTELRKAMAAYTLASEQLITAVKKLSK